MGLHIAYFDESGDDGVTTASSNCFILTSLYMDEESWNGNFELIRNCRKELKTKYGFHMKEELHTKHFLANKNPYRDHNWTNQERLTILRTYANCIASLDAKSISVIIDKTKFGDENYKVLENALKYNIQRIENDSNGQWRYIVVSDPGRIGPMRKTSRTMRVYNPIQSKLNMGYNNYPIKGMIEDMFERDSNESYFIQTVDFIVTFVFMYFRHKYQCNKLAKRDSRLVDPDFICEIMEILKNGEIFNLKACKQNDYGFVIYPRK